MSTDRMIWLDSLRLIAGVSMVGLHATSDANGQPFPDFAVAERWGPMIIRAVVYTARTELFLLISLFLLMLSLDHRPRAYATVIQEQARRLLLPFAFWTVFYAFYNLNKSAAFGYDAWVWSQLQSPFIWMKYFLLGSSKYHMHFLPTLFGLVLFFPLFRCAVNRPWLGVAVLVGLVVKRWADGVLWGTYWDHQHLDLVLRFVKILTYCGYGMAAGAVYGVWRRGVNVRPLLWPVLALGAIL
ncbi:MAG: acyltransferase family protein, partial [Planktomarina sp.]